MTPRAVNSPVRVRRAVAAWDRLMMGQLEAAPEPPPPTDVVRSGSVLRPPASERAIAAAERRLGVTFPPSYRTFVSVSNGGYAGPDGPARAGWRAVDPSLPEVMLLPVEHVASMAEVDQFRYEMWTSMSEFAGAPAITYEGADVQNFHALRRGAFVIGGDGDSLTLLVRVGRGREWQLWQMHKETTTGWSSFGAWLDVTAFPPLLPPLDELLPKAATGNTKARDQLWKVKEETAVPTLVDALDRFPELAATLVHVLGRIDGDDAARAIARFLPPRRPRREFDEIGGRIAGTGEPQPPRAGPTPLNVTGILQRMSAPVVGDLLYAAGASGELAQRDDPRAGPLAEDALRNDWEGAGVGPLAALARLGDPKYIPVLRAEYMKVNDARPQTNMGGLVRTARMHWIGYALAELGDEFGIAVLRTLADAGYDDSRLLIQNRYAEGARSPKQSPPQDTDTNAK